MNASLSHQRRGRRIALVIARGGIAGVLAFSTVAASAQGLPTGARVIHGEVQVSQPDAQRQVISQTSRYGIVEFQNHSVGANHSVRYNNNQGATLSRVVGGEVSQIDGAVSATGSLYLVNPSGIVIGASGAVDTGGRFIASTRDVANEDFLDGGDLTFQGGSNAAIVNLGRVSSAGGDVAFIAHRVENAGEIAAPNGSAALVSGGEVLLTDAAIGEGRIQVLAGRADGEVSHSGIIRAQSAALKAHDGNVLALAGNGEGLIQATGVQRSGGRILLSAPNGMAQVSQPLTATAGADGGEVAIEASFASLGAPITMDGAVGGSVTVTSDHLSLAEPISAVGTVGAGGSVTIETAGDALVYSSGRIDVSGATDGGEIRQVTGRDLILSGTYEAVGESGVGGSIDIGGGATRLMSPTLDASGATGGGRIRVGGEYQGGKDLSEDELPNTLRLAMTDGASIRADATGPDGDGGEVILWADERAMILGEISARPGSAAGAGGFVELSAGESLSVRTGAVATGVGDRTGELLLDPKNITIATAAAVDQSVFILGSGYTYPDATTLEDNDFFSASVSLDGTRLAVGSPFDDDAGNTAFNTGAVYLFTFTDDAFSGGALAATIGKGYRGGQNIDVATLEDNDNFGSSVSLDGTRLAVGANGDDGAGNAVSGYGAAYLFTFTDAAFTGGALAATIGKGYAGGNNIDVAALESGDSFGASVSLDGTRLAVGANGDDGAGNAVSGSGAAYLFTFTDAAFTGGALAATIGKGYAGGKNIDVAALENNDRFGASVSLDGTRLAVGASSDDGVGNAASSSGAVYLFTFTDAAFSGGSLAATIGKGYAGGQNIDVAALENEDRFGSSVSLDGTRLAVGAPGDDGAGNAASRSGAAYLFTFADEAFSGGSLAATIGKGYAGGQNIDVAALGIGDFFGASVSLDGTRLAVGATGDDGAGNAASSTGAAYLFTFADTAFTGGSLAATIGKGYVDGRSIDVAALENSDAFGASVSLDGTRLAVGATGDDGAGNAASRSGAVYLFTFADAAFSGGALAATIGKGYTGGQNIDVAALENDDSFGQSVSLDGTRLAVGATGDDGAGDAASSSGAVYLFTFADAAFTGGALAATIGKGYAGGKNINVAALDNFDRFGQSVSLDGTRLAVGANSDDGPGNASSGSGAAYLFTFADATFTGGTLAATIGKGYTGGQDIDVAALENLDAFGASVSLDGTRLAVGATGDDGVGNAAPASGAAYLFTFADAAFTGGTLAATIGKGYAGGQDIDVAALGNGDNFGSSVSLDGTRLAVGARGDDGAGNAARNSGAAHLFTFTDAAFSGGALAATIGKGYTGGNNIDVAALEINDRFGSSVSLDGTRLAVGATSDGGAGNAAGFSGAVYLFTFADEAFTGGALAATMGKGYTGGQNINVARLGNFDSFGRSVSLDGTRLAVGASGDDGVGDGRSASGAVYLFTFTDAAFSGGSLAATIGNGYTGGNNIDVAALERSDFFGQSVSLDGTRLAVGATGDDDAGNAASRSGAAYLFTFADEAFTGGALAATIGKGYTGGKNINLATLRSSDLFGSSVSLDGTRLAVGATGDDGDGNAVSGSGAAYLFTFTDAAFSGGALAATIGKGYTGGQNIDVAALGPSDNFGRSVSLDGTRLAVGAISDDGTGNAASGTGAAYLFTFADAAFTGGTLAATIGKGYAGGQDIDVAALVNFDSFGLSVSLDGTRLAVGATGDDGADNATGNSGAVYLFTFTDDAFTGGALAATIGKGYTGGKNINIARLEVFGNFGSSVSLDGTRLAVGATGDDGVGNAVNGAGAVYLFQNIDTAFTPDPATTYAAQPGDDVTITPTFITDILNAGTDLILQANNDIFVNAALNANNPAGDGGDLSLRAGRSIFVNAAIATDNGALSLLANAPLADGVVDAHRDAGNAVITLADGVALNAGAGALSLEIADGAGKTNAGAGDLTLIGNNALTGGTLSLRNLGSEAANAVVLGAGSTLTANSAGTSAAITVAADVFTNTAGAGVFTLAGGGRFLVYSNDWQADTKGGLSGRNFYNHTDPSVVPAVVGASNENWFLYRRQPTLTITGTDTAVTYNGAAQTLSGFTVSGLVNGDTQAQALTTDPTLVGKTNAGVYATDLINGGASAIGYALAINQGTLTINRRTLTATAAAADKVYDGTNAATAVLSGNALAGDVVTISQTGAAFADKNVGVDKTVTVSGLSLSGADAGNYVLAAAMATGLADITPRTLTATAAAADKVYDGTVAATTVLSGNALAGDVVSITGSAAFADKNVGVDKTVTVSGLSLSGADAGNYVLAAATATGLADITPRILTATATAADKVYDGTNAATAVLSGNALAGDVVSINQTGAAFADRNVGVDKTVTVSGLSLSGADAGNYILAAATATSLADITPRTLTATATAADKIYDGTNAATAVLSGNALAGDVVTIGQTGAAFADRNVGVDKTVTVSGLSLSGADAGNYILAAATATGLADITPRTLTATAAAADKVYDGTNAATAVLSGNALAGDAVSITGSAAFADRNVGVDKTVTVSGLSLSGADAGNYVLAAATATSLADITPRTLTATAAAADKVYDGTVAATAVLSGDALAGDAVSIGQTGAAFADKNVGVDKTVTVSGLSLSGADAGNYVLAAATATGLADITPRTLTATATAADKVYDGTNAATAVLSGNALAGDAVSINQTGAAFADRNVGVDKTVTVSGLSLSGADAGNYVLAAATATDLADITPRTLTATATASDRVYDGTIAAMATLSGDMVAGDVVSIDHTGAAFDDKNVGVDKTVTVTGLSLSGADAGNYVLAAATATDLASITPRTLTVAATADDKVFDGTVAATSTLVGDALAGDALVITGSATFADAEVGSDKVVTIADLALAGADAGNYILTTTVATTLADILPDTTTTGDGFTPPPINTLTNTPSDGTPTQNAFGEPGVPNNDGDDFASFLNCVAAGLSGEGCRASPETVIAFVE